MTATTNPPVTGGAITVTGTNGDTWRLLPLNSVLRLHPHAGISITPATARALAAHLVAWADGAEDGAA